jgi:glutamate/aspartate transport system permease protein
MAAPWSAFFPALLCLSLYAASRIAEQVRSGLEALPRGQREATRALGLTDGKAYGLVLVPQALRLIIPSLTSEVMGIFKNTSVALTIGLLELTAQALRMSEETFATFVAFGAATVGYVILTMFAYRLMAWVDQAFRIPGTAPIEARKTNRIAAPRHSEEALS